MARKILLADDSVTAQNMGRKILTDAGYDVVTVNNGSAALKRVAEHKPDLIVLDVYMPGYSGLEVCVRLKDSPDTARIPVLLTVGKLEPFKPEEASRVRADGFIVKPFEASELLSALTRLEDRMVPQADGVRFSTTVSGIERFSGDPAVRRSEGPDEDSGWKSRLRFPSKKKKDEPETAPEEEIGVTPFRDFKKGAPKAAPSGSFAVNSSPPVAQEPGLVPDIPRDITPEELDALSELVAKLDGPIPTAENVAPLGEALASAESMPAVEAKPVESKQEEVKAEAAPVTAASAAVVEPPVAPVEEAAVSPEPEKPAEAPAIAADASNASAIAVPAEVVSSSTPEVTAAAENSVASGDETQAEPVKSAVEEAVATDALESAPLVSESTAGQFPPPAEAIEEFAKAETTPVAESPKAESGSQPEPVAETSQSEPAAANAVTGAPAAESETPEPSAEDLAEALRLLTPSQAGGQILAEAGAALVEELAKGPASGPRWVAESVALSAEESSMSLEAEMFKSFAAQAQASEAAAVNQPTNGPVGHEEEEAAEAAVEAAEAVAEVEPEISPAPAQEETMPAIAAPPVSETVEHAQTEAVAAASDEPVDEDVAAVTFADAIRSEETEMVASSADPSFEEAGGDDDMAKDSKGKGKWHQIHATAEGAAKTDVVEAAKQSEEAPKAMAAAASDGASDATAIASIVDSVLADLKPKIVEEIAKKLGKK